MNVQLLILIRRQYPLKNIEFIKRNPFNEFTSIPVALLADVGPV
jgi:hypothetical protein